MRISGFKVATALLSLTIIGLAAAPGVSAEGYKPDPPTNVAMSVSGSTATVTWTASSFPGETSYSGRSSIKDYKVSLLASDYSYYQTCTTPTTTCVFYSLKPKATYNVEIYAENTDWAMSSTVVLPPVRVESISDPVPPAPAPSSAPAAPVAKPSTSAIPDSVKKALPPVSVAVSASGSYALVTWTRPSSSPGVSVKSFVVRSTPASRGCRTRATSCRISGLKAGRSYVFFVVTETNAGSSAAARSAPVAITVAPKPVVRPAPRPSRPSVKPSPSPLAPSKASQPIS